MDVSGWLSGRLSILVSGKYPERFVNLSTHSGIYIKDAVRKEEGIRARVSLKAFRKMRAPARKSGCRVKIIKKEGLPFLLKKWGKRKFFLGGALIFALAVLLFNSFIWTVRIDGNKIITDEEIKFIANYCGLRQGVVKYKVDENKFSELAQKCDPRLAWIWPEIKGTVCYIHIREKTLANPPEDVKAPAEIIAKRSGIVEKITVKRGWGTVEKGDSVVSGQLLIASEKEGFKKVHASGEVYATYWTEVSGKVPEERVSTTYTGNCKSYYSLVAGSFGMSFRFFVKAPFESYEKITKEENVMIFGEIKTPVKIIKTEYKETIKEIIKMSEDEAVRKRAEEITKEYIKELPEGVSVKNTSVTSYKNEKGELFLRVVFECSENIALERALTD